MKKIQPKSILETLVLKYPNYPWDWYHISSNPNLSLEFIMDNLDLPFDYYGLASNPNLTWDHYLQLKKKNICLNYRNLLLNPNILPYIKKNILDIEWKIDSFYRGETLLDLVSQNPGLDITTIKQLRRNNLNWLHISRYSSLSKYDIDNNPMLEWDWGNLSENSNLNLDIEFVKKHLDKKWNWYYLSQNPRITVRDIENNWELDWDIYGLSNHPQLDVNFIEKYPDLNWNWFSLSAHPNFSISYLVDKNKKNQNKTINCYNLSKNPNLTIHDYINYPEVNWDSYSLCHHFNFNLDDIISKIPDPDYNSISFHQGLTIDFIETNLNKLNPIILSCNQFGYHHPQTPLKYCDSRKKKASCRNTILEKSLLEKTWHPSRFFDWCLAIQDKW